MIRLVIGIIGFWITNLLTKFDFITYSTGDNVNQRWAPKFMALFYSWLQQLFLSVVIGVSLGCLYRSASLSVAGPLLKWGVASILLVIPTVVMAMLIVFAAIEINACRYSYFYVTDASGDTGNFFTWNKWLPPAHYSFNHCSYYRKIRWLPPLSAYYLLDEMRADYVRTAALRASHEAFVNTLFVFLLSFQLLFQLLSHLQASPVLLWPRRSLQFTVLVGTSLTVLTATIFTVQLRLQLSPGAMTLAGALLATDLFCCCSWSRIKIRLRADMSEKELQNNDENVSLM